MRRLCNRSKNNPCFVLNGRIANLEVEHSMIDELKTAHTTCISLRRSGPSRNETKPEQVERTSKSYDVIDMSPRLKYLVNKEESSHTRSFSHSSTSTAISNGKRATSAD